MAPTTSTPLRRRHALLLPLILGAGTIGVTATQIAIHAGSPAPRTVGTPTVNDHRYIESINSMTRAEQAAAFGTGRVARTTAVIGTNDRRYVNGIKSLTPRQLAAAYGSGR